MLQIATGKLFVRPVHRENALRGILYTNAILSREEVLETLAGRLLPSSSSSLHPSALIYEFIERIEIEPHGPGVLVSSGVEPYLRDFSVVVSFALNCVCTPDIDLARRLTTGQRGLATRVAPQKLVHRFFDPEIWCQPDELKVLEDFVGKLIGLPRKTFLGVMRALRTYVSGMHRIADDLELAYTLLVASVESLAQDFDGHESDWSSIDAVKRRAIDHALVGADEVIARRVKDALIKVEHIKLASRFRDFVITHTPSKYFRQASVTGGTMLGRSSMREVLSNAYQSRSKYVHQLQRLPDMVTMGHNLNETVVEDRTTHLTLQGLSRLMRSVLTEFVKSQPTLEQEPYNYQHERSGIVQARLAPQYWVGRVEGDISAHGRDKLEGFLEQLASVLLQEPGASITDLRSVLTAAAQFTPNLRKNLRLPYLALHVLFNTYLPKEYSVATPPTVGRLIESELGESSIESLLVHALMDQTVPWALEEHKAILRKYFDQRGHRNGIRLPRLFEVSISLELAERLRSSGDFDKCREVIGLTVENYPGHSGLLEFEEKFQLSVPINWRDIMLPSSAQTAQIANG